MKYIVKIPVIVEQANGKGIPRNHYASIPVTAKSPAEAAKVVADHLRYSCGDDVPDPFYDDARDW